MLRYMEHIIISNQYCMVLLCAMCSLHGHRSRDDRLQNIISPDQALVNAL